MQKIILSPADKKSLADGYIVTARNSETFEPMGQVRLAPSGEVCFISTTKPSTKTNGKVVPDLSVTDLEDKGYRPVSLTHAETILALKEANDGRMNITVLRGSESTAKLKKVDPEYETNAVKYRVTLRKPLPLETEPVYLGYVWFIEVDGSLGEAVEVLD